jgi:hypothetical protein
MHFRRFRGGSKYDNSRNKLYEVFEKELEAFNDYVYRLNCYNEIIKKPGLHNIPSYGAFIEKYKQDLDNSMKKWQKTSYSYYI